MCLLLPPSILEHFHHPREKPLKCGPPKSLSQGLGSSPFASCPLFVPLSVPRILRACRATCCMAASRCSIVTDPSVCSHLNASLRWPLLRGLFLPHPLTHGVFPGPPLGSTLSPPLEQVPPCFMTAHILAHGTFQTWAGTESVCFPSSHVRPGKCVLNLNGNSSQQP